MQVTSLIRPDSFEKLDEMLRRGDEVARKKLAAKNGDSAQTAQVKTPQNILPPEAADDVDQAYGAAMSLLGNHDDSGRTGHMLDPERVAALLGL